MKPKINPDGYKETEIGAIPNDWRVLPISRTMKLINGFGFKPHQWSLHGVPIIRIQNLNSENAMFNYFEGVVDEKFHVKKGDLLFAWSGSKGSSFGARVWKGVPAILNQHIFRVVPNSEIITPKFSFYALRKVQEQIEKMAHGFKSSFVHVKKGDLSSTLLPIPPIKEQTAIANALSDVDALITSIEKLITKKQAIKTATMQQLLTGKKRLPPFDINIDGACKGQTKGTQQTELGEIPEDWEVSYLGDLVNINSGESPSRFECLSDGIPYYKVEQLNNGTKFADKTKYFVHSDKKICKGSLIFPKRGASILLNKIRILKHDSFMDTNLMTLTCCERLNNEFLFYSLNYSGLDSVADTTSIPQINNKHIVPFSIGLPCIEEQVQISEILSNIDEELNIINKRLVKTQQIKQGMMQELLTGKMRLPFAEDNTDVGGE